MSMKLWNSKFNNDTTTIISSQTKLEVTNDIFYYNGIELCQSQTFFKLPISLAQIIKNSAISCVQLTLYTEPMAMLSHTLPTHSQIHDKTSGWTCPDPSHNLASICRACVSRTCSCHTAASISRKHTSDPLSRDLASRCRAATAGWVDLRLE